MITNTLSKEKLLKQIQEILPEGYQFVILLTRQMNKKDTEITSLSSLTRESTFKLAVDFANHLKEDLIIPRN